MYPQKGVYEHRHTWPYTQETARIMTERFQSLDWFQGLGVPRSKSSKAPIDPKEQRLSTFQGSRSKGSKAPGLTVPRV